jgi:hypothetical protein
MNTETRETVTCHFCGIVEDEHDAIESGWIPSYRIRDIKVVMNPVCADCVKTRIVEIDGESVLIPVNSLSGSARETVMFDAPNNEARNQHINASCNPRKSGASAAACRIGHALFHLDGLAAIVDQDIAANSGFIASCCRVIEREMTQDNNNTSIEIGDQVQSIECNWQGRVTAFVKDDCTMLECHHVSAGEIELDDKRYFDPRDVRLLRKGATS